MAMDTSLVHHDSPMDPPWLRAADGGRHGQEILRRYGHPESEVTYPWTEVE